MLAYAGGASAPPRGQAIWALHECRDGSVPLRSEWDEVSELARRAGALDVLHLGDAHLSAGDTELRQSFGQLSQEGVRFELSRCPHRDVRARGRLAYLALEHVTPTTER